MESRDYYLILGVSSTESQGGIRAAFRDLARTEHPDRCGAEGNDRFREIVEAYEILSDPDRRKSYDATFAPREPPRVTSVEPAPRPHVSAVEVIGGTPREQPRIEPLIPEPMSVIEDFAEIGPSRDALFDRLRRNFTSIGVPKSEHAEALNVVVPLGMMSAHRGGSIWIGLPVFTLCAACGGTGHDLLSGCLACDGRGLVERTRHVEVEIPLGTRDGDIFDVGLIDTGVRNFFLRVHVRTSEL